MKKLLQTWMFVMCAVVTGVAQTDTCTITTLPYTYDFNDVSTAQEHPFPSACWQRSMSNNPEVEYGHLSFFSNFTSIGIMPPIDTNTLNIQDLQVSFYAGNTSSYGIEVGVMTNPSDTSTFTKIRFVKAVTNAFQHFVIPLSSYTGGGRYIAFRFVRVPGTYNNIYVDDIVLDTIPDCQQPSALAATAVTPYSVDLSWVGFNPDYPDYTLYYRKDGETEWTSKSITVSSPTYTLDGLAWAYQYDIYLESECAVEASNMLRVSTACAPIPSVPQFWDFESNITGGTVNDPLPACWNRYNTISGYPLVAGGILHSGTHSLVFGAYGVMGYGILPPINTDSLSFSDLQLSFYAVRRDDYGVTSIDVGVMSNPTDPSSFTLLQTVTLTGSYEPYDIPLTTYGGSGTYIAIRSSNTCYVDDLSLIPLPSCPRLTGLTASMLMPTSVNLTWDSISDTTRYVIHYLAAGESVWATDTTTVPGVSACTLDGLLPSTQYQVYVTSLCNPYLPSNTVSFKTLCSVIATLPQFWDFEEENTGGTTEKPLPGCWNRTASQTPYVRTYSNAPSGNHLLYMERGIGTTYVSITPIDTSVFTIRDLQISFTARFSYSVYSAQCVVGVMSNPAVASTFVPVDTLTSMTNTYKSFDVPLSNYTGNGQYISLKFTSSSVTQALWLDDLRLMLIPDCERPANLEAVDVQGRSVRLNWNHAVDTASYFVHYKAENDSVWHTVAAGLLDTTSFTLTGLLPLTQYQCRVEADCYPGGFSNTVSFTTPCGGIASVPQFWDFETESTGGNGSFPLCWYRVGGSNSSQLPSLVTFEGYSHSGNHVLESFHGNTFAVLPPIWEDSLNINELQLTFYASVSNVNIYYDDYILDVGVLDNPDDVSTFTPVQRIVVYGTEEYQRYTIPFSNYSGTGTYIAIKFYNSLNYFDDFTLDRIPDCPEPSNLKADSVYDSSVLLSWVGWDTSATSYTLFYKSVKDMEWDSLSFTATSPHYTLTGLQQSTSYEVYLVSNCLPELPSNIVKINPVCSTITALPQTWDFEYHNILKNVELPECWWKNNVLLSVDNTESNSDNQSIRFIFYNEPSIHSFPIAMLPPINTDSLNINQLQLSFKIRTNASMNYPLMVEIGVKDGSSLLDTPSDSMIVVQTLSSISADYQEYDIPFASYSGNGNHIAIRIVSPQNGPLTYVWLDDVVLDTLPDCPRPHHITMQQLTQSSVTIGWLGHDADYPTYTCFYRPVGDTVWSIDAFNSNIASHTLVNLQHSTEYELYLVNDCDTTRHSEIKIFSTLCDNISQVPYRLDFEHNNTAYSTPYILPDCWNRSNGSYPYVIEEGPVQGYGRMLCFHNDSPSTVILPSINTDSLSINDLQISFAAMATEDHDYNEFNWANLTIGVMNHPDSTDSFVPVYQITEFITDFQEYSIPFANYVGTGSYIAIRNTGSYHTDIYLDDLVLDTIPACPRPSALSASHPTAHTVTLHWTGYDGTNGPLMLYYRVNGESTWTSNLVSITGNSLVVSGLAAHTSYQMYIAAACDPDLASNVIIVSTLCEAITSVPQLWDFEESNTSGTVDNPLPECWNRTGDFYPHVEQNDTANFWAYSGSQCLSFLNSAKSTVVLTAIDTSLLQISDLMVSFFAKTNLVSDNNRLVIGVMSDPTDTSTFVAIDTVAGFTTEYQAFDVLLTSYTGYGTHIGIRTLGSANNMIYLDDFSIVEMLGCSRPVNISALSLDIHSAALTWESNADSAWYIIAYKPVDGDSTLFDTTGILYSNLQVLLTGLEANTTYEVQIAASCYPGAFSNPFVFTTLCTIIDSLPVFWDFEENNTGGSADNPLPACWERVLSGTNSNVPGIINDASIAYQGTKSFNFHKTTGWYVTLPKLSDSLNVNQLAMTLHTRYSTGSLSYYASIEVGVMTDPTDPSTFTVVDTLKNFSYSYHMMDIDFSSYIGNGKYIAFHDISILHNLVNTNIYIDDLMLYLLPSCPRPTTLTVENTEGRSVDISWTHDADSAVYVLFYKPTTDTVWLTDTAYTTTHTITDLIPLTTYELYVTALCNPENPTVVVTFTTECALDIIDVPQIWDFEDTPLYQMPACWSRIATTSYPRVESNSDNINGKALIFFQSSGGIAIMPYINANHLNIRELQISFDIHNSSYNMNTYGYASIDVGVMTDPTDPATFTLVQRLDSLSDDIKHATVAFYLYEGSGTYIAFRDSNNMPGPNVYGYDINIDNLTLDFYDSIPCAIPQQPVISDITDSSAVLTWQNEYSWHMADVTYLVYYKPTSDSIWQVDTVNSDVLTHALQHLESETDYDCYVVAMCNPDSPTEMVHFETEAQIIDSVGVEDYTRLEDIILIYPNPAQDHVDIRVTDENVHISGIEVFNISGKVVRTVVGANDDSSTYRINLAGLAEGIYIAHVRTETGIIDLKFVKKR